MIDAHAHYISPIFQMRLMQKALAIERLENNNFGQGTGLIHDGLLDKRRKNWLEKILQDPQEADAKQIPLYDLLDDMEQTEVESAFLVSFDLRMNSLVLKAVQKHHPRFYGIFYADPFRIHQSIEELDKAYSKNSDKIIGVKVLFQCLRISPLEQKLFLLYQYCSQNNLPIQFHFAGKDAFSQLNDYKILANRFPKLKIICLHAGGSQWRDIPSLLKREENIYVQVEALQIPEVVSGSPDVLSYLIKNCGSEKIMFGSDWVWQENKYFKRVNVIKSIADENDRANISKEVARQVYNI